MPNKQLSKRKNVTSIDTKSGSLAYNRLDMQISQTLHMAIELYPNLNYLLVLDHYDDITLFDDDMRPEVVSYYQMKTSEDSISIETAISEAWVAKLYEQLSNSQWLVKELGLITNCPLKVSVRLKGQNGKTHSDEKRYTAERTPFNLFNPHMVDKIKQDIAKRKGISANDVDLSKFVHMRTTLSIPKHHEIVEQEMTDFLQKKFSRITVEAAIFDFSVYLPNKDTGKVEMAPPAFTFMPYYIDQDKGWSGLYDSFASITQYKSADRIKSLYYHLNIYTKGTVELMAERDRLKERIEILEEERDRLNTILSALREETANLPPADTICELDMHLESSKKRIEMLVTQIGEIRNNIQSLEMALQQHRYNLRVIQNYISAKDDNAQNDEHKFHVCPNCGYTFDEEIFNLVRSNYGMLNEDYICQQISLLISTTLEKLNFEKSRCVSLGKQMKEEETAFRSGKNEFDIYVRQRGLADSVRRFQQQLSKTASDMQEIEQNIKEISKELRKLPNKKEVEEKYVEYVRLNIMTLDAWDPAYDGTIHLLKPIKAQGTLENKIILAQLVALFQTMEYFKTSATRFSFVVDSPRAKEASVSSSKDILKMIAQMEMLPQIILATIDYSEYDSEIETPKNIIVLTEKRKLLNESDYVKNEDTIIAISELLRKQA